MRIMIINPPFNHHGVNCNKRSFIGINYIFFYEDLRFSIGYRFYAGAFIKKVIFKK